MPILGSLEHITDKVNSKTLTSIFFFADSGAHKVVRLLYASINTHRAVSL
jgi:hypothetical protein